MVKKMKTRLSEVVHLQAIEDNPLDAQDITMFEMFEKKGFSPKERRAYILAQCTLEDLSTGNLSFDASVKRLGNNQG